MDDILSELLQMKKISKTDFLDDFFKYMSVQRGLEVFINICIDIGNHIVSVLSSFYPRKLWGGI